MPTRSLPNSCRLGDELGNGDPNDAAAHGEALATNCRRFIEAIAHRFPEGTRVTDPAGGVVLWVELPRGTDGLALFERSLAAGIGIAPGIVFSANAEYRNFVRLSAGHDWSPEVESALERLGRLSAANAPSR